MHRRRNDAVTRWRKAKGRRGSTAEHCACCGGTEGPFTRIEGLFTVLMCPTCLAARARGRGPYPDITDEEMRAGLHLIPTWALEQKVATAIATTLGRSAGAVANALQVLAGQGAVVLTQAKPRRYTIAPAGSDHANTNS